MSGNELIITYTNELSNTQIEEKFSILAAETEKHSAMYRNFDEELKNVILCLRDFLNYEYRQDKFDKFYTALRELNYEVFHFCVYERFLTEQQQVYEFYKKIPSLIEPHSKTLPFLKDLKTLIEATEIFKEDESSTIITIDFNVLQECYRSLHKIFTEARIVKPLRNFYYAIEILQQKYSQQINYKAIEQDLLNILNEQKKVQAVGIFKDSSYYRAMDWKFFKVIYKKYNIATIDRDKQEILNNIKEDVFNFRLHVCKVILLMQNTVSKYFKEEIKISEFKLQNADYFNQDYRNYYINPTNFETLESDKNQYCDKECNESLLPFTRFVRFSPMLIEEEIELYKPLRFEITCLLTEDFPEVLKNNVEFVKEAIQASFRFEKSEQYPSQELIEKWREKINEFTKDTNESITPLISHLQVLINFWTQGKLKPDFKSDHHSIQWYNAYKTFDYVIFKESFKNADLSAFVDAVLLSNLQTYLENISNLILQAIGNYYPGNFYFDENLFMIWRNKLQRSPKDMFEADKRISDYIVNSAEFLYIKKIYKHGRSTLINKDYFEAVNSLLLQNLEEINKHNIPYTYNITISVSGRYFRAHNFTFSKLELLKFCTQLQDIKSLIIPIEIRDLSCELQQQYYEFVKKDLQNRGYANSEGRIVNKVFEKNVEVLKITEEFFISLQRVREKFIKEKLQTNVESLNDQEIVALKDSTERYYKKQKDTIEALSFLPQFKSLALMGIAVTKIKNVAKANEIQRLIKDCFSIVYINEGRFKNGGLSDLEKHEYAFKLAGQIIENFLKSSNSFIFQVVPSKGDHAFYIGIKNIFHENKFQIVIVDGGGNLPSYKKSIYINNTEYEDPTHGFYHPRGSEVLNKEEYKEFLKHYVYRVLAFRYTPGVDEENLYLLESSTGETARFSGYSEKIFEVPLGISLSLPFRAQTYDNCAIYNLAQCLIYLLDISKTQYAIFKNELFKSADEMISEFLKQPLIPKKNQEENTGFIHTNKVEVDSSVGCSFVQNNNENFINFDTCEASECQSIYSDKYLFSDSKNY